jgi:hypothetical protein
MPTDNAATLDETEAVDRKESEQDERNSAPAPKRKGRPKGTAGKKAVETVKLDTLPPEILEVVALAPMLLTMVAVKQLTTEKDRNGNIILDGIQLAPNAQAMAAVTPAFRAWLSTLDFELTPGFALLAVYATALASAMPDAMVQLTERAEKESRRHETAKEVNPNANVAPKADAVDGSQQADSAPSV